MPKHVLRILAALALTLGLTADLHAAPAEAGHAGAGVGHAVATAPHAAAQTEHTLVEAVAEHGVATHGEHATPSVFAGTIAQSAAAVLVFLILLALLYKKAWGPILTGLQDRENKIRLDLENAQRAAAEAGATLTAYKKQLAQAQQEAAHMIEQGRADAQKVAASLKEQTQGEITQMKDRATADIDAARQQALTEIYQQTATLATAVAGKILRREIQAGDQQQLVNEALREIDDAKLN